MARDEVKAAARTLGCSPPWQNAGRGRHPGAQGTTLPHHTSQLPRRRQLLAMSYYFAIVGTRDNPLFEHEFGTSRGGGDGIARFRDDARHMNQFIVHSSLDIVEEVQWGTGQM